MTQYIKNDRTNKWVILSPKRAQRPEESNVKKKKVICPFCYGNEKLTPPEVLRIGEGKENSSGWGIRVIPNKYKITDIHEVIIHSPHHELDLEDLSDEHVSLIFQVYKQRYNFYKKSGQVVIFNNTGKDAAESLTHDHSQLTVVPNSISLDDQLEMSKEYLAYEDTLSSIYCPKYSEWSYETIIKPIKSNNSFGDSSDKEIKNISSLLKKVILILKKEQGGKFSYNYYIYPGESWYLRLIPRLIYRGGFELATGIMVNTISPQNAADLLSKNI